MFVGGTVAAIYGAAAVGTSTLLSQGSRFVAQLARRSVGRVATRAFKWLLRKYNIGAGLGDLGQQLASNGWDLEKVNWVSVAAQSSKKMSLVVKSLLPSIVNIGSKGVIFESDLKKVSTSFGLNLWSNYTSGGVGKFYNGSTKLGKVGDGLIQLYDGISNFITGVMATSISKDLENRVK